MNNWATENFGIDHFNRGIDASSSLTCTELLREKKSKSSNIQTNKKIDFSDIDNEEKVEEQKDKYWKRMHKDNNDSQIEKRHTEENYLKLQLENEVSLFRNFLIKEKMLEDDCISTKRFWLRYKSSLPNLFKLALKLLNIQASTAFII